MKENKELLEYFKGNDLAANVWQSKYAQKGEVTPNDMHSRMAKEFVRIENEYIIDENILGDSNKKYEAEKFLSKYGGERKDLTEEFIFNLFKDFKYIIPQGSVMTTLGTNQIASLSNCVVIEPPKDSYNSIMKIDTQLTALYKRRCGVGFDISNLRPNGTEVNNSAKSTSGATSFMHRFSNTTREVAQNGRRGALMLTIDVRHPDIMEFIKIKRDKTSVTGANISIKVNNEFMKAVENNEDYILRFPCNSELPFKKNTSDFLAYNRLQIFTNDTNAIYCKKIKAKEVWDEIVLSAKDYAEPGLIFEDNHINYSPDGVYEEFRGTSTNPCQPEDATILTKNGITILKNISIGDEIWSGKKWTKVVNKWSTGIKEVYKYNTTTGYFLGTKNHRVVENGKKIKVENAESIDWSVGDSTLLTSVFELASIMDGLVIGDGSVHKASNNLVYLCTEEKDEDYFDSEISDYFTKSRPGLHKGAWEIKTTINHLELPKTYDRVIPDRYFYGNEVTKRSFLRGLFSANGSVSGNRVCLKQSSKILIEQVREMLSSLGIHSYITTNKSKDIKFSNGIYNCKQSYDINITSGRDLFLKYIGFIQIYKNNKIIKANKPKYLTSDIKEVEFIGKKEVFDITVDCEEHTYWTGGVLVSNCGEIFMNNDTCRLIVNRLDSYVINPFTKDAYFDFDLFYRYNYEAMRLSDDLVDLEIEYIDRIINKIKSDPEPEEDKVIELNTWLKLQEMAKKGRRTGLGITALGDCLVALNLKYDSEKALNMIDTIFHKKMESELDCTIDLSILRGSFENWNCLQEYSEVRTNLSEFGTSNIPVSVNGGNQFYEFLKLNFNIQSARMIRFGRRNISISTCAPTGTVSLLADNCTGGIEPLFSPFYFRKKKVNPHDKDVRIDFTDENGDNWQEFAVLHPKFKDWITIAHPHFVEGDIPEMSKEDLQQCFEESPWYGSTANDIDWIKRVEIQAIIQKYISHSISSTINLPKTVTSQEVSDIYIQSWKKGLKGITVYVDGSRDGVLTNESVKDVKDNFDYKDAIKRPKSLLCNIHTTVSKGKKWNVIVGILNDKPYEVFTVPYFTEETKLNLVKVKQGRYDLLKDKETYSENITSEMNSEEEIITRLISTSLRHGADIKFIVEQLNKSHGDITSFSKAISRALKTYIPEGAKSTLKCSECGSNDMVFVEGCKKCLSCGSSLC